MRVDGRTPDRWASRDSLMHSPPETITTERLVVRRPTCSDAAAKYSYARDPEVMRHMDWATHTSVDDAIADGPALVSHNRALRAGRGSTPGRWVADIERVN